MKPDLEKALRFLIWMNPDKEILLRAYGENGPIQSEIRLYAPKLRDPFAELIAPLNSPEQQCNIFFDPNSPMSCARSRNAASCSFDHITLGLEHTSANLSLEEVQRKILLDMLDPFRRPRGLPLPTALWNTADGCEILWRTTEDMGLAKSLDTANLLGRLLTNGDFCAGNRRFLQLPFTVSWPGEAGGSPKRIEPPQPFSMRARPAEHDWYAFRRLVPNADEWLGEYDDEPTTA